MIINGIFTDRFEIHKGLKQHYPLSAALYIQALNPLIIYICWSHFSRVEVTLVTTGTTVAFTYQAFNSSSFSFWYVSSFSCSFFLI